MKQQFIERISESIDVARHEQLIHREVFSDPGLVTGRNEYLLFMKPEITMAGEHIRREAILDMVYSGIEAYGFQIHNILTIPAGYLARYQIIAQHYGVINQLAADAVAQMSEAARESFRAMYGHAVEEVRVLGGLAFLEAYPDFNARSLFYLWQNGTFKKLAGGTYCMPVIIGDETVYLVNGFHPNQLLHFTQAGRCIVAMTLSGDVSWREARRDFIGSTDPSLANPGSLRRDLFDKQQALGLGRISASANGVHLSAGPVEALVELQRYNSDFSDPDSIRSWADFDFGRKLQAAFPVEVIGQITGNVNLLVNGNMVSVFDLTEEMNSDEALNVLVKAFM